jgi:glycosyltransferase involved in cell wall biosynthesis
MTKKILYIHQYFVTPNQPGGTRSYWFCLELIQRGYQVVMITSRNSQKKLIEKEIIDGITVLYIKNSYSNHYGILRRLFSFVRFMMLSTIVAFKQKNVDLIYATSTPLTIAVPALMLHWLKRIKFIFEVRDLWPEVPIQMGAIKSKFLIWLLNQFETKIYKNALHIVALSPGMLQGVLSKGISLSKVSMIPNMSKINEFYSREKNPELVRKFNLSTENFYLIHFGAMGIANGLIYLVNAMELVQKYGYSKIYLIFAGSGKEEDSLKENCRLRKIDNVLFLGTFKMDEMSELVNIADCTIVSFKNIPILQTNSPNKLFDALSAQKAIIVNSAGWTKQLVEENRCGAYVDPENPEELARLLIDWSNDKEQVYEMGLNARQLAEKTFDKTILCSKFGQLIDQQI